jgi:hypothetical protein
LLIYDGKHAPNEGNIAKEDLFADPDLVLIKSFSPKDDIVELNGFSFEVLVFEKKLLLEKDTLVFENFTKLRPLLSGRLERLRTDEAGKPYLDMVGWSHYVPVFTFWKSDNPEWTSHNYQFDYEAADTLEVWLNFQFKDGHGEDLPWKEGEFALPEMPEDVISTTLFLRNPQPDVTVRLYGFGLHRVRN